MIFRGTEKIIAVFDRILHVLDVFTCCRIYCSRCILFQFRTFCGHSVYESTKKEINKNEKNFFNSVTLHLDNIKLRSRKGEKNG